MVEELEARIIVLEAENAALRRENAKLHEMLQQAREDADNALAQVYSNNR